MYKNDKNKFCFLIVDSSTNKLLGDINLMHFGNLNKNEIEISIMIAFKKDRRKGLGKKALKFAENFVL